MSKEEKRNDAGEPIVTITETIEMVDGKPVPKLGIVMYRQANPVLLLLTVLRNLEMEQALAENDRKKVLKAEANVPVLQ